MRCPSRADRITTRANCFHGLTAALGVHLLQNSMNVVPHREFGQVKGALRFLYLIHDVGQNNAG
jgi:hypothetical protein